MRSIACVVAVLGFACGDDDPGQGELGSHCYPNGTCNVTLACVGGICVAAPDAAVPDASIDAITIFDAAFDAPTDALCEPSATPPTGHHSPNMTVGCMSAAGCHNAALGLGVAAPAYSYAGTLYKDSGGTMPFGGATIILARGGGTRKVITAHNGEFFLVPGVAGLDAPTNVERATAWASQCPNAAPMVGLLVAGGGDCDGCHRPGGNGGQASSIHLP